MTHPEPEPSETHPAAEGGPAARSDSDLASMQPRGPTLTDAQKQAIHAAASAFVAAAVCGRPADLPDGTLDGAASQPVMGAFVTLKRRGRLRSCCGTCGHPMSLGDAVREAAVRTATQDMRLPRNTPGELPYLDLEVSLLHSFQPVTGRGAERALALIVGRHGLQIRRGPHAGLLLPGVATEHGLEAREFLEQVCRKAGLPHDAWTEDDAQLLTFETCAIRAPLRSDVSLAFGGTPRDLLSGQQLQELLRHCQLNLRAQWRGATPSYYLPGGFDGTVEGAALQVRWPGGAAPLAFSQLSWRPALPLQATLLQLTEAAAAALRQQADVTFSDPLELDLAVAHEPAMHGTLAEPDLAGFDPRRHCLIVYANGRAAWLYDSRATADQLVDRARRDADGGLEHAELIGLTTHCTAPALTAGMATRRATASGPLVRPPAVAGMFYPGEPERLQALLDQLLSGLEVRRERWAAVLVPHAGLAFSGRIAAAALSQVEIPETVIVIGPNHTGLGANWAVAPHATWSLPGARLEAEPQLARALSAAIDGLQLDEVAHRREHAIEVELPLLARLAPNCRVAGITIGRATHAQCRDVAQGMAAVIARLATPPLLIISSDMNHFAPDAENRRRDELALAALERLDPAELLVTVREHQISMCGVLPAVIVLETLRQLGRLTIARRVAYGTSADANGDPRRVVGYAGMLFR